MYCINWSVFFYVFAISLQISGAVMLLWYSASTKRDDVIKRFMKRRFVSENKNTNSIEYDEKTYKEEFKVAYLNKISFGYIAVGYIINVWGDCSSFCKIFIVMVIVICSVLVMFLTYKGVLLWTHFSKKVNMKISNEDLERLGICPDFTTVSFDEIENNKV